MCGVASPLRKKSRQINVDRTAIRVMVDLSKKNEIREQQLLLGSGYLSLMSNMPMLGDKTGIHNGKKMAIY